MQVGSAPERP